MRQPVPSRQIQPICGPRGLIALVRLLGRQAAREFAAQGEATVHKLHPEPGESEITDAPDFLRARDIVRLTGNSPRTARRWIADGMSCRR